MDALERLTEARIQEAIEEGVLDDLPGHGKPLVLEDVSGVPAELRGAYSVLRNAGCLPEEMELAKERVSLRELIEACTEGDERATLEVRQQELELRYQLLMERRGRTSRLGGSRLGGYGAAVMRRLLR